ncbi:MAG: M20/M25/M40 family metallo-hydrolase [Planctomycetota bacterium]|jgi:tripeptide aminopeptidase|nr:M20/M25/M40 family metallo-hydrolase [Planctomycetota bacterium]
MPDYERSLHDTFFDLVRVPSPSLSEREVAKVVARKIRALGFEPLEDGAGEAIGGNCGNLVVKVPGSGSGPRILMAAHIDTVEKKGDPAAVPVVDGNWVSRDGGGILGADDKSGVAILLELLGRLRGREARHGDLLFAFTVAEEIECLGAAELDPDLFAGFDAGVVLDYSRPDEIVVAAPTKVAFRMEFNGVAGHAAAPERRINAAHVLAKTIARLPIGRLDPYTTSNIGIIRAGAAINVIPGSAYAEYEIRSHRKDVLDFHVHRIIGIIEGTVRENRIFAFGKDGGGFGDSVATGTEAPISSSVDVDVEVSYEGYRLDESSAPVRLLVSAVEKAGQTPGIITAQGGSDANILNRRNLPTAVLGCGMYGAHSDGERANLADMQNALETLTAMVMG